MAPARLLMHAAWTLACPGAGHGAVGKRWSMSGWAVAGLLAAGAITLSVWGLVAMAVVRVASAVDFVVRGRRAREVDQTLPWIASLFAVVGFLFLQFTTERYAIPSDSMMPTIAPGDAVYASELLARPHRGDVIVFTHPCEQRTHIKRVIAVGGDTVEIRCGKLYVNGAAAVEDEFPVAAAERDFPNLDGIERVCRGGTGGKLVNSKPGAAACEQQLALAVPDGTVFVLGDNRPSSQDSRMWGVLPVKNVLGRVVGVAWPPSHFGGVK